MNWALHRLELDASADERAIKRAYARHLRLTRPDEDPAAFQQLHEAYQAALAWVRQEPQPGPCDQSDAPDDAGWPVVADDLLARPQARPCVPPLPPSVGCVVPEAVRGMENDAARDMPSHAQQILRQAQRSTPGAFGPWLEAMPVLWSLRDKPLVGHALLDLLAHGRESLHTAHLDLLAQCFGWEDVHDGVDPDVLAMIRARLHRRWVMQAGDAAQINAALHREGSLEMSPVTAERCLRYLALPWHAGWALWRAVLPEHVADINRMLDAIAQDGREALPPAWDRRQVGFWRSLTDVTHIRRWRVLLATIRCGLVGALVALMPALLAIGSLLEGTPRQGRSFAMAAATLLIVLLMLGVLWVPLRWALRQLTLDRPPSRWGWLLALPAPLLAIASLVMIHGQGLRLEGTTLLLPALALATARWVRRDGGEAFAPRNLVFPAFGMFFAEAGIALILLLWVAGIKRDQRARAARATCPPLSGHSP